MNKKPPNYAGDKAEVYGRETAARAAEDPSRQFLKDQLQDVQRSLRVVDVGCGSGVDLRNYKDMGFYVLVGVEPRRSFRSQARKLLNRSALILDGAFEKIPLPDMSVDVLTSRFSLHYCTDVQKALTESARVLSPGGKFIAVVSHPDADQREPKDKKGWIKITLFNGTVPLTYPLHTRDEYLGPHFQRYFKQDFVTEYCGKERDGSSNNKPNSLCFTATRLHL